MTFLTSANGYIPSKYDSMAYLLTAKMNVLVQSGVIVPSPRMDRLMSNGGTSFELPFWNDIANTASRVSAETPLSPLFGGASYPLPDGLTSSKEIFLRACRNMSWGATDLSDTVMLDGDPMGFMVARNPWYLSMKLQEMFLFTMIGIFADNDAAPSGTEHVIGDLTLDISNAAGAGIFSPGQTTFGAAAHLKALQLLGDRKRDLKVALMHSIVETSIALQDLIETVRDSQGQVLYTQFMGMRIVIDDDMTSPSTGVFDTYYFGLGAIGLGHSTPKVPLEYERFPGAGNGAGMEVLWTRWEWAMHPYGHQCLITPTASGPTDSQLQLAASWQRVYPERKQIKIVRVRSREA